MDAYNGVAMKLGLLGLLQLTQEQIDYAWKNTNDSRIKTINIGGKITKFLMIPFGDFKEKRDLKDNSRKYLCLEIKT